MVLFIPDISHHQAGIDIQRLKNEGAAALIARVGQGAGGRYGTTRDREWARHRREAIRVGLPLVAYWYIGNSISPERNAELCKEWMLDPRLPIMLDHEHGSGNIAFYNQVVAAFARAGLRVVLGYIPKWYYDEVGGGTLTGPPLVNSRYPFTSGGTPAQIYERIRGDTHSAWDGFGGKPVALWQFTSSASWAGMRIDANAFRGSRTELAALIGGATQEDDMALDDKLPPITLADGKQYTLTVRDVIHGLAQYIAGQRGVNGLTAHPQGQYVSRILATDKILAALAADKDIDVDQLAAQVVAAQRDLLAEVIRDIVPDEQAELVVQRMGERLAALSPAE